MKPLSHCCEFRMENVLHFVPMKTLESRLIIPIGTILYFLSNLIVLYMQSSREGPIPRSRGSRAKCLGYKQRQKFGLWNAFTHTGLDFRRNRTEFAVYLRNVLFLKRSMSSQFQYKMNVVYIHVLSKVVGVLFHYVTAIVLWP
jgi:hypothetical protein